MEERTLTLEQGEAASIVKEEKSLLNTVLIWVGIGLGVLIVLYGILRIIKR